MQERANNYQFLDNVWGRWYIKGEFCIGETVSLFKNKEKGNLYAIISNDNYYYY